MDRTGIPVMIETVTFRQKVRIVFQYLAGTGWVVFCVLSIWAEGRNPFGALALTCLFLAIVFGGVELVFAPSTGRKKDTSG